MADKRLVEMVCCRRRLTSRRRLASLYHGTSPGAPDRSSMKPLELPRTYQDSFGGTPDRDVGLAVSIVVARNRDVVVRSVSAAPLADTGAGRSSLRMYQALQADARPRCLVLPSPS